MKARRLITLALALAGYGLVGTVSFGRNTAYTNGNTLETAVASLAKPQPAPRSIFIGQILTGNDDHFLAEVEGRVRKVMPAATGDGVCLQLGVGTATLDVDVPKKNDWPPESLKNRLVRAVGICQAAYNVDGLKIPGRLQVSDWRQIHLLDGLPVEVSTTNGISPQILTTAEQVSQLSTTAARRGFPVSLRGVVTGVETAWNGMVIQDATGGLFFENANLVGNVAHDSHLGTNAAIRIGDFVQIEGTTVPGLFAPMATANRLNLLGTGQLPEPLRPSWDQLFNGSLDAQYVELKGVVIATNSDTADLLTPDGIIRITLILGGKASAGLARYLNDLVVLRGVLLAQWNWVTRQVIPGEIRICDPVVTVQRAAEKDAFSVPRRTPSELLLFDSRASLFQRVCLAGQLIYLNGNEGFAMDGMNGFRFMAETPGTLQVGDRVQVSGLPELGGPSPVLLAAVARATGHGALPAPRSLVATNLNHALWDATRVRLKGELIDIRETPKGRVLDLKSGSQFFVARLEPEAAGLLRLPAGCRLELTGTYAALNGKTMTDAEGAAFEIWLSSPDDVTVLARPPWWTPRRLAMAIGTLMILLLSVMVWVRQLRRKVEQRTAQLAVQIQKREQIEHQHAFEQERARVARDLHDQLGSGLTEISMLAARAGAASAAAEKRNEHLQQVEQKACEMVTALDEIVWAMNPKHDSTTSLAGYFCQYADRFLGLAMVACRTNVTAVQGDYRINSLCRHQLFLAFKEGLTNVVRHSRATEVRLQFQADEKELQIVITDNGRGLPPDSGKEDMDGVSNMRERLQKLGGTFEISNESEGGATLCFRLPLD